VNNSAAVARVKVSADGHGVVSHAGVGILQEMAGPTGLSAQVTGALADTYRGPWRPMRRVRCSPIWPPRSPARRTASVYLRTDLSVYT
jgi:hypothetical protein